MTLLNRKAFGLATAADAATKICKGASVWQVECKSVMKSYSTSPKTKMSPEKIHSWKTSFVLKWPFSGGYVGFSWEVYVFFVSTWPSGKPSKKWCRPIGLDLPTSLDMLQNSGVANEVIRS